MYFGFRDIQSFYKLKCATLNLGYISKNASTIAHVFRSVPASSIRCIVTGTQAVLQA